MVSFAWMPGKADEPGIPVLYRDRGERGRAPRGRRKAPKNLRRGALVASFAGPIPDINDGC